MINCNKLNNIIHKNGIKKKKIVYKGLNKPNNINKFTSNNLNDITNDIFKAVLKKGNKVHINTFQSTSLDINVALKFIWNDKVSLLLEIDTSVCPYFYIIWNNTMNAKKEFLQGSEFELLLPRNKVMEYTGKKNLFTYKRYKDIKIG